MVLRGAVWMVACGCLAAFGLSAVSAELCLLSITPVNRDTLYRLPVCPPRGVLLLLLLCALCLTQFKRPTPSISTLLSSVPPLHGKLPPLRSSIDGAGGMCTASAVVLKQPVVLGHTANPIVLVSEIWSMQCRIAPYCLVSADSC